MSGSTKSARTTVIASAVTSTATTNINRRPSDYRYALCKIISRKLIIFIDTGTKSINNQNNLSVISGI